MKTAISVIVVVLVVAGGYFLFAQKTEAPVTNPALGGETTSAPLETTSPATGSDVSGEATTPAAGKPVTVTYDGTNFSPTSVSIKVGDTVTFVNSSNQPMWVASDVHPAHTGYSGTSKSQHCPDTTGTAFDQCSVGSSYTFTFGKTGSWKYHNHASASAVGTVSVSQ
ncbi:MAG: plastocyanin/azurin family copper-binding protein [Patescibacteria group bacterium]